jgi:hypothetical protein
MPVENMEPRIAAAELQREFGSHGARARRSTLRRMLLTRLVMRSFGLPIIGEIAFVAHEIEQVATMAPPYAGSATSIYARSEAQMRAG